MFLGHPADVLAKMPFFVRFSIVNNRKPLGHRPVDPCLSRRESQGHPAGVPGIFLSLCALFFPESERRLDAGTPGSVLRPSTVQLLDFRGLLLSLAHGRGRDDKIATVCPTYGVIKLLAATKASTPFMAAASSVGYPLTRSHCENNSLRFFFVCNF